MTKVTRPKIKLGQEVEDVVTGFKGIATSRTIYMRGCDRYSVSPPAKDGVLPEQEAFDEPDLRVVGDGVYVKPEEKPGGPRFTPSRDRR